MEFWYVLGICLPDQPPVKALGQFQPLMSFSGRQRVTGVVMIVSWKEWVQPVCLHSEKPGFLWTLPHASFLIADSAFYFPLAITHSYKYDYMLILLVLLINHWTWGPTGDRETSSVFREQGFDWLPKTPGVALRTFPVATGRDETSNAEVLKNQWLGKKSCFWSAPYVKFSQ